MVNKFLIGVGILALVAVGSIGVWKLADDDGRRVGALEPIEKPVPLAWRGAWTKDAEYSAGQVVAYEGSSYVAEAATAGEVPNAKEGPWALMATKGLQGLAGTFNGTFQSPNGSYSLVVANDGIVLQGPGKSIKLQDNATEVRTDGSLTVVVGANMTLNATGTGTLKSTGPMTVESGGVLRLKGATIQQN